LNGKKVDAAHLRSLVLFDQASFCLIDCRCGASGVLAKEFEVPDSIVTCAQTQGKSCRLDGERHRPMAGIHEDQS
jgi:hypothetical protein